jgi:hypothetical protein
MATHKVDVALASTSDGRVDAQSPEGHDLD